MAELTSISISSAENGCMVRCSYRTASKSKKSYDGYDYTEKNYVGPADLMEKIMEEVGEEIEMDKKGRPKPTDGIGFTGKKK